MRLTAAGAIEVHESETDVVVRGTEIPVAEEVVTTQAETDLFPDIYLRIENSADSNAEAGTIVLTNVWFWFNDATDNNDSSLTNPIGFPDTGLVIPPDFDGIVYFLLGLSPRDPAIAFGTELPDPAQAIYVRTLADVTRVDDVVTIRQRCFGLITAPAMQVHEVGFGLF